MRITPLLALGLLAIHLAVAPARAETRTYRFVPDGSLPYAASCGECGLPYLGAKSDIAGTFTVTFDQQAGTGSLVALDDQLVNFFDLIWTPTGSELQPPDQPPTGGVIPSYFPDLHPPLEGSLVVDGDVLRLTGDGSRQTPQGTLIGWPTYVISMTGDQATFSMDVPILDYAITVTNAAAVLVPEPAAWTAIPVAVAFLLRRSRVRSS